MVTDTEILVSLKYETPSSYALAAVLVCSVLPQPNT